MSIADICRVACKIKSAFRSAAVKLSQAQLTPTFASTPEIIHSESIATSTDRVLSTQQSSLYRKELSVSMTPFPVAIQGTRFETDETKATTMTRNVR